MRHNSKTSYVFCGSPGRFAVAVFGPIKPKSFVCFASTGVYTPATM